MPERSALRDFLRARAAQSGGASGEAARGFSRALAADPGNAALAGQALNAAVAAGDWPLATTAAARLEASAIPSRELALFTLAEAVRKRDWRGANASLDAVGKAGGLDILLPPIRAWVALSARRGDPLAVLGTPAAPAAAAYAAEHRALLLLALKRRDEGRAAIEALASEPGGRSMRLRLAGAARLAAIGDRGGARALLVGEAAPIIAARQLLDKRGKLPAAVDDAASGLGELFARFAVDLAGERVTSLALVAARLATRLAPENSETWLVTGELLSTERRFDDALAAIGNVRAEDPFATLAASQRAQWLVRAGRSDAALAEAARRAAARSATAADLVGYADLLVEAERHREAVPVYERALALRAGGAGGPDLWLLHLLHGAALEESGRWAEAKAALQAALKLAPGEPQVLNYLGYSQLERRENLDEAERLIREASRLDPDNASITDSLGWALFRRGRIAEAIAALERAAALEPSEAAISEHLGDAYWAAGRRIDARYAWSAALLHADAEEGARLRTKIETGFSVAVAAP